jgi:hypothetical protein
MAAASVAVVVAGHTARFWRIEKIDFPLSWAFAGVAAVAFLAGELCDSLASKKDGSAAEQKRNTGKESKTAGARAPDSVS